MKGRNVESRDRRKRLVERYVEERQKIKDLERLAELMSNSAGQSATAGRSQIQVDAAAFAATAVQGSGLGWYL